ILLEHLRSALRHSSHEMVAKLVTGALEGNGQNLAVDLRQYFLHAPLIEEKQIFKNEHELPDRLHQERVALFDDFQDVLAAVAVQSIKHLRYCVDAAVGFAAHFAQRL